MIAEVNKPIQIDGGKVRHILKEIQPGENGLVRFIMWCKHLAYPYEQVEDLGMKPDCKECMKLRTPSKEAS